MRLIVLSFLSFNLLFIQADSSSQTSTTIARQAAQSFVYTTGFSQLVYTDGGQITVNVFLFCDAKATITATKTNDNTYSIILNDPCACAGKCTYKAPSSLGGGSIFVLILISIVAAYLLIGVVILRFFKQQRGLDMIPHRSFWKQVGGDSIGGVRFVVGKVTGRSNAYQSV